MRVKIYQTKEGRKSFKEWFELLKDKQTSLRIDARLGRLRNGNLGDCKSLGSGLFEMRFHFQAGYRIYFGRKGDEIVILLSGGEKRTQAKDIDIAKNYWQDYKQREKNG